MLTSYCFYCSSRPISAGLSWAWHFLLVDSSKKEQLKKCCFGRGTFWVWHFFGRCTLPRLLRTINPLFSIVLQFSLETEHFLILVGGAWVWSFRRSSVVGTIIFLFLIPSLVSAPIFVGNRAFF